MASAMKGQDHGSDQAVLPIPPLGVEHNIEHDEPNIVGAKLSKTMKKKGSARNVAVKLQPLEIDWLELDFKTTKEMMRQVSGLGMEDPIFGISNHTMVKKAAQKMPFVNFLDDMKLSDIPLDMREELSVCSDPTASVHKRLPSMNDVFGRDICKDTTKEKEIGNKEGTPATKRLVRSKRKQTGAQSAFVPPPSVSELQKGIEKPAVEQEYRMSIPIEKTHLSEEKPRPDISKKNTGVKKSRKSSKNRNQSPPKHKSNSTRHIASDNSKEDELQVKDLIVERKQRKTQSNLLSKLYASDSRLAFNDTHGRRTTQNDLISPRPASKPRSKSPRKLEKDSKTGIQPNKCRSMKTDNLLADCSFFVIERPPESLLRDALRAGDSNNGETQLKEDQHGSGKERAKSKTGASKLYASDSHLVFRGKKEEQPQIRAKPSDGNDSVPDKDFSNSDLIFNSPMVRTISGLTMDKAIRPRKATTKGSREKRLQVSKVLKESADKDLEASLNILDLEDVTAQETGSLNESSSSSSSYSLSEEVQKTKSNHQSGKSRKTKKRLPRDGKNNGSTKSDNGGIRGMSRSASSRGSSSGKAHPKRGRRKSRKNASATELLQSYVEQKQIRKPDKRRQRCHSLDTGNARAAKLHSATEPKRPHSRGVSKTRLNYTAKGMAPKPSSSKDAAKRITATGKSSSLANSLSALDRANDIRANFSRYRESKARQSSVSKYSASMSYLDIGSSLGKKRDGNKSCGELDVRMTTVKEQLT